MSSYSLTALARAAKPLMKGRAGAILTLTYLGAVRSIPGYNVMGVAKASLEANVRFLAADLGPDGIRVNAISAGPIKTLAAAGIAGFRKMLGRVAAVNPIRRNVTQEDVGNAAAFLCSDLAAGITGEVLYVDGGYNTVGMSFGEGEDSRIPPGPARGLRCGHLKTAGYRRGAPCVGTRLAMSPCRESATAPAVGCALRDDQSALKGEYN